MLIHGPEDGRKGNWGRTHGGGNEEHAQIETGTSRLAFDLTAEDLNLPHVPLSMQENQVRQGCYCGRKVRDL